MNPPLGLPVEKRAHPGQKEPLGLYGPLDPLIGQCHVAGLTNTLNSDVGLTIPIHSMEVTGGVGEVTSSKSVFQGAAEPGPEHRSCWTSGQEAGTCGVFGEPFECIPCLAHGAHQTSPGLNPDSAIYKLCHQGK